MPYLTNILRRNISSKIRLLIVVVVILSLVEVIGDIAYGKIEGRIFIIYEDEFFVLFSYQYVVAQKIIMCKNQRIVLKLF